MTLAHLNIHHVRNISTARLVLHPRYNIICGPNGSGKTSFLEAIYLLGSGRSFRTREISALIQQGEPSLTVFARMNTDETISIQKSLSTPTHVKLNHQSCYRSSELAHFLPCQTFYQDVFQIIDEGPAIRRSLLDWGLFHVKQSYHEIWKDYRRVLKQRNALLRRKAKWNEFAAWNKLLVEIAMQIDLMRTEYFQAWSETFQFFLNRLTNTVCGIHYYKGWDRKNVGKDLLFILQEQFDSDLHSQYTHSGAHQADILFDTMALKAKHTLSRGQQKIILMALKLAQSQLISKPCVYLFDDIAAELDAMHFERFVEALQGVKGQFFLTTIETQGFFRCFDNKEVAMFEVQNGCFT